MMTRASAPRDQLLRFVLDSEGRLTEDLGGRLPGRGLHVIPSRALVEKMLRQPGRMGHALGRTPEPLEAEPFLQRLEQGLARRLQEGLGLARRAGGLRCGLRAVEESGKRGMLMLLASDTAHHTREKFQRLGWRLEAEMLEILDRRRFGVVCGSDLVAVLAVFDQGVARRVRLDAMRWQRFIGE